MTSANPARLTPGGHAIVEAEKPQGLGGARRDPRGADAAQQRHPDNSSRRGEVVEFRRSATESSRDQPGKVRGGAFGKNQGRDRAISGPEHCAGKGARSCPRISYVEWLEASVTSIRKYGLRHSQQQLISGTSGPVRARPKLERTDETGRSCSSPISIRSVSGGPSIKGSFWGGRQKTDTIGIGPGALKRPVRPAPRLYRRRGAASPGGRRRFNQPTIASGGASSRPITPTPSPGVSNAGTVELPVHRQPAYNGRPRPGALFSGRIHAGILDLGQAPAGTTCAGNLAGTNRRKSSAKSAYTLQQRAANRRACFNRSFHAQKMISLDSSS